MAVTRKPKKALDDAVVDVDALISKGGSVAGESVTESNAEVTGKATSVILRLPPDIANRVDLAVKSRRIKTPRHTWLLEAVMEKLDRELGEG